MSRPLAAVAARWVLLQSIDRRLQTVRRPAPGFAQWIDARGDPRGGLRRDLRAIHPIGGTAATIRRHSARVHLGTAAPQFYVIAAEVMTTRTARAPLSP
jgi:hypothetical protein